MFQFTRTHLHWNPYGWGRHRRGRLQAPERHQRHSSLLRMQRKTCHSQTLCPIRTQPTGPKTQSGFRVVSLRQFEGRTRINLQMDMLQEPLRGFREPMEEGIYCLVDLVVELVGDRRIEEAVKQSALVTPSVPVWHHGEGPGASQPRISHRLSAQSWKSAPTLTYLVSWVIVAVQRGVSQRQRFKWEVETALAHPVGIYSRASFQ